MNDSILNDIDDKNSNHVKTKKIILIKNMQSLPEEVVIKFIESKGKLIRTKKGKLIIDQKIK